MKMLKNPHEIEIEHLMMECRSYTTARPLIRAVTMFLDVFDYYIIPMILIWKYVLKRLKKDVIV